MHTRTQQQQRRHMSTDPTDPTKSTNSLPQPGGASADELFDDLLDDKSLDTTNWNMWADGSGTGETKQLSRQESLAKEQARQQQQQQQSLQSLPDAGTESDDAPLSSATLRGVSSQPQLTRSDIDAARAESMHAGDAWADVIDIRNPPQLELKHYQLLKRIQWDMRNVAHAKDVADMKSVHLMPRRVGIAATDPDETPEQSRLTLGTPISDLDALLKVIDEQHQDSNGLNTYSRLVDATRRQIEQVKQNVGKAQINIDDMFGDYDSALGQYQLPQQNTQAADDSKLTPEERANKELLEEHELKSSIYNNVVQWNEALAQYEHIEKATAVKGESATYQAIQSMIDQSADAQVVQAKSSQIFPNVAPETQRAVLGANTHLEPEDIYSVFDHKQAYPSPRYSNAPASTQCQFCLNDRVTTDLNRIQLQFTNVNLLLQFVNQRGMVLSRRRNKTCRLHQKRIVGLIKRARVSGLMSYMSNWRVPRAFCWGDEKGANREEAAQQFAQQKTEQEVQEFAKQMQQQQQQQH